VSRDAAIRRRTRGPLRRGLSVTFAFVLMAVLSAAAGAAQLTRPDMTFGSTPTLSPTPRLVLNPTISGYSPTGCVQVGGQVSILGQHFGSASGKAVALGGHGIHVDLTVVSWTDTKIVATIPKDPRIELSQSYYIGVEKSGHAGWLSNIDKNITTCATAARTTLRLPSGSTLHTVAPGGFAPSGGSSTGTSGGSAPAGSGGSTGGATAPSADYYAPPAGGSGGGYQPPPSGGGSLLARGLPPPPAAPAPTAEETKKDSPDVEPGELVVVSANVEEARALAQQAGALGYSVKRRRVLKGLGLVVSVLRLPEGTTVAEALRNLRAAAPKVWIDANHRYRLQGADAAKTYGRELIEWGVPSSSCGAGRRIGLVDTPVDRKQPALRGQAVTVHDVLPAGVPRAPADHGTAVAALLVGRHRPVATAGLVPGAHLYAAAVFRRRGDQLDTTAEDVVAALDWLVRQHVRVINLSLGGPRNLILEAAVRRVEDLGIVVVAAAGNGGPGGKPVYPAAQQGVVAVTAVDADRKPYEHANRGAYIAFAAPGVDVWVARPGSGGVFVSGTSYAAPFVTAAIARMGGQPRTAVTVLAKKAEDLGKPGRDPVFGWGLIRLGGRCGR